MPVLMDRPAGAVAFRTPAGPVTVGAFRGAVAAAARALPPGAGPLVTLCDDRLAFAVGLGAAAAVGRVCLLPSDTSPLGLASLADAHPGLIAFIDGPAEERSDPIPPRHRLLVGAGCADAALPALRADALVAIGYTSGSTGQPTAHEKRWGALVARSRAAAAAFGLDAGWTLVGTVPARHMYGFETTVLLPLHVDCASWCGPHFFPEDVRRALETVPRPRALVTTPLHLRALLRSGVPLPAIDLVISATAPLEDAAAAAAEAAWGAPVREIFGATEVGSIAQRRTLDGPVWRPYPGVTIEVAPDGGARVRAPGAPAHRLADLLEPCGGGFRLVGRDTDIVKLGGRRASLAELNRQLVTLPGVEDGAFLVPDGEGARLVAFAVAPGMTAAALLAALRHRIEATFLPRRLHLIDALPRDALGKLPRTALLRLERANRARPDARVEAAADFER